MSAEPSGGAQRDSDTTISRVGDCIEDILKEAVASGTRIIMSTHDMGQAKRLASEVIFMLHGQVREFGHAGRFFEQPQTQQARAFLNGDIVD